MSYPEPSITVNVDVTNPGQFFACCGLLELADRLWPSAEGWFNDGYFMLAANSSDATVLQVANRLRRCELEPDDTDSDEKTCPLRLREEASAINGNKPLSILLDWWLDNVGVGDSLKTWAGQQKVTVISRAMLHSATIDGQADSTWLNHGRPAHLPKSPTKIVEPFCFDARRFAHALDTGFSLDTQGAETIAHPAVELLCLIGLQRFRPQQSSKSKWHFEYWTWMWPLCPTVAAAVVCGAAPVSDLQGYRFALRFRDNQKRYKAFGFATPIGGNL